MKIIFSSSKEMNQDNLELKVNDINFSEVYQNIDFIKSVAEKDCYQVFKTKENIYSLNQAINHYSKPALNLYQGISFRQLKHQLEYYDDLYILSALYGISKASDYISPYRYDYTMLNSKNNHQAIYQKINDLLANEDIVYNLASQEFSKGIKHPNLIDFSFLIKKDNKLVKQSVFIKKARGQMVDYLIENKQENIEKFSYDDLEYNKELSNDKHYVFIKKEG